MHSRFCTGSKTSTLSPFSVLQCYFLLSFKNFPYPGQFPGVKCETVRSQDPDIEQILLSLILETGPVQINSERYLSP